MGLFNLFQFGSIGEEEQTIADIVQGMYFEGYDFIHFCSLSVPFFVKYILPAFAAVAPECPIKSIVANLGCFSLFKENGIDSFTECPSLILLIE